MFTFLCCNSLIEKEFQITLAILFLNKHHSSDMNKYEEVL